MIKRNVSFGQKSEQDTAINKLIKYMQRTDTWDFPKSMGEHT